tara:strand:+ start:32159 stop:32908 length:750 start_codon:yes stop_codon:yes gene_type:complete
MSIILYQNSNIIGVYENYELCCDFIKSIENLGWATNFKIVKYKINTCIKEWEKKISFIEKDISDKNDLFLQDNIEEKISETTKVKTETKESKKKKKKEAKERQKEQYNINLLKAQKEKIIESKNKYEVDLKLYKDFKSKKDQDNSFEIPEMFLDKYEIFNNLDSDDNLSWDSFATEYKEKDFNGRFSNIFEVSNEFDSKFCNNLKIESSESSESDSESESEIEETSDYNNSSDTCGEDIIEVFSSDGSN